MPLNNQNPLAQLHDIITPSAPSFWPPAPLYWLLLIISIVLITGAIYLYKRVKSERQKYQMALSKLQQLKDEGADFIALNKLVKGVALLYFPRQQVASLHGEQWFDFLHTYSERPLFGSKPLFLQRLYNNRDQSCASDDFEQVKIWIKKLPQQIKKQQKECKNNV
ncbi:MAG: hypothetical protein ACJAT7_002325 [Psychromonas sp.]|jgi:hypothetical protein|uniref:DUF4381 domain-containing protein n=1 Tax=Psychromonas sp. TaxID=1884585 RepID=UPI0039E6F24E